MSIGHSVHYIFESASLYFPVVLSVEKVPSGQSQEASFLAPAIILPAHGTQTAFASDFNSPELFVPTGH